MSKEGTPEQTGTPLEQSLICEKCKKPSMKKTNFRTGSVSKPKADMGVCSNCGHRVEL